MPPERSKGMRSVPTVAFIMQLLSTTGFGACSVMEHRNATLGNACPHRESPSSQDSHLPVVGVQDAEEQQSIGIFKCDRYGSAAS